LGFGSFTWVLGYHYYPIREEFIYFLGTRGLALILALAKGEGNRCPEKGGIPVTFRGFLAFSFPVFFTGFVIIGNFNPELDSGFFPRKALLG